jgi:hypothetical protein
MHKINQQGHVFYRGMLQNTMPYVKNVAGPMLYAV